jgi:hemin uptake protein HemP
MAAEPNPLDAAGSPSCIPGRSSCGLPLRAIPSAALLGNRDSVTIEHRGKLYVLRATRAGKLILTK